MFDIYGDHRKVDCQIPTPTGVLRYQITPGGIWHVVPNKITVNYRPVAAKALSGFPGITHFAVGTGTSAAVKGDTALGTEVARELVGYMSPGSTSFTVIYQLATGTANGNTISEVGLFDAATGGNMFARVVLSSTIAKTSSLAPLFKWTINLSAAT